MAGGEITREKGKRGKPIFSAKNEPLFKASDRLGLQVDGQRNRESALWPLGQKYRFSDFGINSQFVQYLSDLLE